MGFWSKLEFRIAVGFGKSATTRKETYGTYRYQYFTTLDCPKLIKGQEIITKSTNNPDVPGNTAVLAALSSAQTALAAANAATEANRLDAKQLMATREATLSAWNSAITIAAAFTEAATDGVAEKILTTGFNIRAEPTLPQPVTQVKNVEVSFTGMPGYSNVRWKRETNADAYVLERSAEPITAASWENVATVTEAKYEGNGTIPGLKCWYRVAAVNRLGQGPWSEPALRPVM